MTKSRKSNVFSFLTKENIREHLIHNDSTRPHEISHLIVVPLDQLAKHLERDRFSESDYMWSLKKMSCHDLEKVCTRLNIRSELTKQRQRTRKAMLASIQKETGNIEFRWDRYLIHSAGVPQEDAAKVLCRKVSHVISPIVVRKAISVEKFIAPRASSMITRGLAHKQAFAKAGNISQAQVIEPLQLESLSPNEIDEKIEKVMAKIESRFEKMELYFEYLKLLMDAKERVIEQSIQADEGVISEKEQSIQQYKSLICQKKESIREDIISVREKKRSRDQFLRRSKGFLEGANHKYQCVGEALRRARVNNSETLGESLAGATFKTAGLDDGD